MIVHLTEGTEILLSVATVVFAITSIAWNMHLLGDYAHNKIQSFFAILLAIVAACLIAFAIGSSSDKYYITTGLEKQDTIFPQHSFERYKTHFVHNHKSYDVEPYVIKNFTSDSLLFEQGILVYFKQRKKLFGLFYLYRDFEEPYLFSAQETIQIKRAITNKEQVELKK